VDLCNRLATMSANADGPGLAEILCRLVRLGEGAAKVWTRPSLIADLRTLHPLTAAPIYAEDTRILQEEARNALADIRSDIGGVEIARDPLLETVDHAVASHVFSNISGLPGCGKSVVLKRYAERAMAPGPILFLKSDRLQGGSWRTYANALGLRHQSEVEILAELGAGGMAILFIDGIDRIKQDQRGVVTDLLRAIETEKALSHWRVLVTSRDQGLEVLRSWIPPSLYARTGVGNVAVGTLDDGEAEALAAQRPELHALLFGAAGVREIARRPFFAAVLADQAAAMGLDPKAPPQAESELIEAWWAAGGYNVPRDAADRRQRALLELAENGAPSLVKGHPRPQAERRNYRRTGKPAAGQNRRGSDRRHRLQVFARHIFRVGFLPAPDRPRRRMAGGLKRCRRAAAAGPHREPAFAICVRGRRHLVRRP